MFIGSESVFAQPPNETSATNVRVCPAKTTVRSTTECRRCVTFYDTRFRRFPEFRESYLVKNTKILTDNNVYANRDMIINCSIRNKV